MSQSKNTESTNSIRSKKGTLLLIPSGINENPDLFLPKETLKQVFHTTIYIAERARTARRFLKAIGHPDPISSLTIYEIPKKEPYLDLNKDLQALERGENIGLLSEAGSPGVADPGAEVVRRAHQMNARVLPLVGPSSILLALMASGLNGQKFSFHGYLSPKRNLIGRELKMLEQTSDRDKGCHIFIETPYRNHQVFEEALKHLRPSTLFTIALDLCSERQFCKTLSIAQWREFKPPELHKIPCVFILQSV